MLWCVAERRVRPTDRGDARALPVALLGGKLCPLTLCSDALSCFFTPLPESVCTLLDVRPLGLKHEGPAKLIAGSCEATILTSEKAEHLRQPVGADHHKGDGHDEEDLAEPEIEHGMDLSHHGIVCCCSATTAQHRPHPPMLPVS